MDSSWRNLVVKGEGRGDSELEGAEELMIYTYIGVDRHLTLFK